MGLGSRRTNSRLFLFGTLLGVLFAVGLLWISPAEAATGINQQINFQGRLLNAAGATVPDGYYNIQFKIYQDGDGQSVGNTTGSPAGTLKWTESYLNAATQGVRVQNGFMSVQLGSVTPFGSSIDWNQSTLWLSMNIGNTNATCTPFTSCAPDGEMVPMQAMTSAVYALNAMQLGGLTAASFGQLAANQTWTGVNTFRPASDSTSAFRLQNQANGTAYVTGDSTNNQLILGTASSLTGKLAFATVGGGTLTINPTSSASSFTITLPAETGTVCTTNATGACSVAGSGFVQLAPLAVQADSTANNTIFINKTNATGNIVQLQKNGTDVFTVGNTGNIVASGTYNSNAFTSTALTFGGASPTISPSTVNAGLTAQANGTGTLTLNTGGAGTVNLGTTNTTTVVVGNSSAAVTVTASTLDLTSNTINLGTGAGPTIIGTNASATGVTRALTLKSGNTSTASSASGAVVIQSGDSSVSGGSGSVTIDSGAVPGAGAGAILIGSTNSTSLTMGNTGANTTTLIQGGSGTSGIQINQGLGGTVTIGTSGTGSTVNIVCGASATCGLANNATDHSTIVGSTTGTSTTTVQGGTGGLTLTGNITASGTYNSNTFSSTALTFSGANPVIGAGTVNTGLTVRANGTGILTLNTSGAGTVNLGTASTTTIGIGSSTSANTILGTTGITGAVNINTSGTAVTTIGAGSGTAGDVVLQGGAGTKLTATNTSGTSVLSFTAPSTAGTVTYRLPGGGTGGTTYDICTTQAICTGYGTPGANTALSNLSAVAINTSLLPASNNTINAGSATLGFASGFFGTNLQSPLFNSADQTAATTNSSAVVFRSGTASGTSSDSGTASFQSGNATSNTGNVTIASGNSTFSGNSGNITLEVGTVTSGTAGAISIGGTRASSLTIGNAAAGTTTLIQGGSGGTAVSMQAATNGAINIGTTNINSVAIGSTSNTTALTFGQSTAGETINIANAATTAATTVSILSGAGTAGIATLNLGNNTRATTINLGNINPAAARTISIGNTTATGNAVVDTINIATNPTTVAGGNTVNIATGTPTGFGTNLVTVGSVAGGSATTIHGGTGSTGIQIIQGTGGGVVIGSPNTGSTVTVQCGAGTSSNCGFGVNANDHSTYMGSATGVSNTVIQSGTGGINLNGAVTTSGAINGVTLSSTALTFSGANPTISSSTSNTGMTLQSNGTGTLTLNSGGAGTVNVGTANTTTIGVGSTTAAVQTLIQGGTGVNALGLQVGTGGTLTVGTAVATTLNIGNTTATTVTSISGGTNGTSALALQVGNGGAINIGTTAQTSVQNIGNTSASTTTLINGGTSSTAIQMLQGAGGVITIGGTGANSVVNVQCGAGTSASCGFGTNATDHTTTFGSTTGTSLTTIQSGTGGISLAGDVTVSANKNLTLASGTGRYLQTYTGTTTDAFAITATSLTTGTGLKVTTSNNTSANTAWSGLQFNMTNAQSAIAVTSNIFGVDYQFTQASTVAGNTEAVANFAIAPTSGIPTDNTVDTIVNIANNDTATGNLVNATNGIKISATTSSNIINAISLNGTFQTNLITTSTNNYTVTNGGAVTQAGNLTLSGASPVLIQASATNATMNIQANGTGAVVIDTTGAGTASLGATNAATVTVGGSSATNVSVACATSAATCNFGANTTDHTTNVGSSTGSSLTAIQGGTSGITLTSGNTVASILSAGMTVRTTTNSATAFRVTNNLSNSVITVDTSTPALKIYAGAGGANYLSLSYNDATSTGTIAASAGTTAVGSGSGSISVLAGTSASITMTANATSLWRTTAGSLTIQSGTSSDLILTSGSGIVNVSGSSVVKLGQSAGDPGACTAGAIVYNTSTNTLRGCQGGTLAWSDLVNTTTPTMQQTYTASTGGTTSEVKLDTTRGALDIQGDNAGAVTTLLNVRTGAGAGLGTAVFSVTNSKVQIGLATSHSSGPITLILDSYQQLTAGSEPVVANGAMYYDADANQFRCAAGGSWQPCGINSIQSAYVFEDEFLSGNANSTVGTSIGGVGDLNWNVTSTTSCTEAYNQSGGPGFQHDHPGVLHLTTGAAAGNGCAMTQGGTGTGTAGTLSQMLDVGDTFKSNIAITAATGNVRTGWMNTTSDTAPTSGAYWQYTGGNLQYCYANNAVAVCTTARTLAVNTWAEVQIRINSITATAMSITFTTSIAGVKTTNTTVADFDAGVINKLGLGFMCYASTTTAQSCLIDYIQWSGYNTSGTGARD